MNLRTDKKVQFVCQACGYTSPKWMGRCPECSAWNTMIEEIKAVARKRKQIGSFTSVAPPQPLTEIQVIQSERYRTGLQEMDQVLGGGIVPGSLILVGGDPGIGKSTLLMQAAFRLAQAGQSVLYVSGEESSTQIKLRADRLGMPPPNLYILCETRLEEILAAAQKILPAILVVDSIQTLTYADIGSVPGSVSQVRECGGALMTFAKSGGPAIFLVGHVTKEGVLAGPRILEHMVDTVLYFEGDRQHGYRILRTVKNRFGPTNEVGVFEMGADGLKQIGDPSRLFLNERRVETAGSAIAVSLEGTRPLLIEIQSLTAASYFGMPQRRVSGLDYNRSCLMLAVLERRAGLVLSSQDVFLSVAGGLTVNEPAIDLAIVAAVASSLKDRSLQPDMAIFGEVGLGGEIRAVSQPERRCQEAAQLGFKRCLVPQRNLSKVKRLNVPECIAVDSIQEALEIFFP